MAMHESDTDRVIRQGSQAWQRLKKDKNWGDWIKVGEAHLVGREWAMHQAGTNRPQGKAYNMAFGEWLVKYKFDDMDKGNRARLFEVMDNLGQIEEWRRTLTIGERLKLNHPNAVLRRWKAHMAPESRDETGEPKPTLRDSVANLSEEVLTKDREIADLKAHIAELEAARAATFDAPTPAASGELVGPLGLLIARMKERGIGERDIPELIEANPNFDALDLIDLGKLLKDFADDWKTHQKRQAKGTKVEP
jgi:hypothetical protein